MVSATFWSSLDLRLIAVYNCEDIISSIWVLVASIVFDSQHIAISVDSSQFITFVYASVLCRKRRIVWEFVHEIAAALDEPWVVLGDFNVALGAHKKSIFSFLVFLVRSFRMAFDNANFLPKDT